MATVGLHWEQGGDVERARECYLAGARRSVARYALAEAEEFYRAYLRLGKAYPNTGSVTAHNELATRVLWVQGRTEDALQEQKEALKLARALGDLRGEGKSLQGIARCYHDTGRIQEAIKQYEKSLVLYRQSNDRRREAMTLTSLAALAILSFFIEKQGRKQKG